MTTKLVFFGKVKVAFLYVIFAAKSINSGGGGYESDTVAAIEWCVNQGADVISMSWGWAEDLQCDIIACDSITSREYTERVNYEYMKILQRIDNGN